MVKNDHQDHESDTEEITDGFVTELQRVSAEKRSKKGISFVQQWTFPEYNRIWRRLKGFFTGRNSDARWFEYYMTGRYRGFYLKEEHSYKLSHITQLTFTNGEKEVYGSGSFKEEALLKIFDRIDKLYRFNEE